MLTISAQAALTVDDYEKMQKKHGKDNQALELQVRMYLDGLLDGLFMASRDVPREKQAWCIPDDQPMTDELAEDICQRTSFSEMNKNPAVNYTHWQKNGVAHSEKEVGVFMRKGKVGDWRVGDDHR